LRARDDLSEASLRRALVPPARDTVEEFPERQLMREVLERASAIEAVAAALPRAPSGFPLARGESLEPPLALLARALDGVGFVNAEQDGDGVLRRVQLRWEYEGRVFPQLGLAAAAAFLDLPAGALALDHDAVRVGRVRLPLRDERFLLSWPRIDPGRGALGFTSHVSIGRVLALRRKLREIEEQIRLQERLTRGLAPDLLPGRAPEELDDPDLAGEIEEELHEEVSHRLDGIELVPEAEREELDRVLLAWRARRVEIARARRELAGAELELRGALDGNLVFIGWNATGSLADFYPTAADPRTPGVVVHAIVANSCLTGYVVAPTGPWVPVAVILGLGALTSLLASLLGPRLAFLLALLLASLFLVFDTLFLFSHSRVAMATATPLAGVLVPWAGTTAMRAVKDRLERARLTRQFGARISPSLFEFLLQNPEVINLEGQEREVTSFFCDLAGFTAISESLDSRATVALLNRYMWTMNDELTKNFAYVNKFLGDGLMAVWGAFHPDTPHADRACRAALGCLRRLDALLAEPDFRSFPKLSMRVGIATGVVTLGDCGAPPDLRDYTVIGDSVNLAARLESANKQFGTRILVNDRTRELAPLAYLTRPLGRIVVVGQDTPAEVHELLAARGEETPRQVDLVERTALAVTLFRERRLSESADAWRDVAARHGSSRLAELYLAEIEMHLSDPTLRFDGVLRLTRK
ncbi:MAG: adenylate/guanylate cyclase domain-containing protein, partial [Planctomycetota bacterium]